MASHGMYFLRFALLLNIVFVFTGHCESKSSPKQHLKILYYTASDDGSHHLTNTKIAAALVRRGHEVTFLLSNSYTKWQNASGSAMFKFATHQSMYTLEDRERGTRELSLLGLRGELAGVWSAVKIWAKQYFSSSSRNRLFDFHYHECNSLLGDNNTIRGLQEEGFDMLVGEDLSSCNPLLAEVLGIKFVLVSGTGIAPSKGSWYGIPSHPAYIPERQSGLTDTMSLMQRTRNTYLYLVHGFFRRVETWKYEPLKHKYNLSQDLLLPEMHARAQLWLFYGDFEIEFARPLQPNVILLASPMIGLPSVQEIPTDQKEFIEGTEEGVVLFTLGSHVNEMDNAQAQMFANGLAKLSQRVIWQFTGSVSHLRIGKNTMVVQWMPQQKLMEHPNTVALLSHGGLNGMYEAAWYGLPMVGIPLFGDHFDNMERAVAKGMALQLDITTLSEDTLSEATTRVSTDPRFRDAAQRISRMLRDQPITPSEKAAFWISHVGKFGGEHLRPRAADLTWIENNLVDVYALFAAILFGALAVLYLCCMGCLRLWLVRLSTRQEKLKIH